MIAPKWEGFNFFHPITREMLPVPDPRDLSTYVKRVMAVTPEEVRRVASEYLTPDKMSLVVVGDEKTVKAQVAQWAQ